MAPTTEGDRFTWDRCRQKTSDFARCSVLVAVLSHRVRKLVRRREAPGNLCLLTLMPQLFFWLIGA